MALHIPEVFKDFLKLLEKHDVEYLLIGGYAVAYHGYPRATADLDVFIAVNPDNAAKIDAGLSGSLVSIFPTFPRTCF